MCRLIIDSLVLILAIVLFTKGFLLVKLEIGFSTPSCPNVKDLSNHTESHCWTSSLDTIHYEKLVILIIDALRYDFAFYQKDDAAKLPFHNNMPVFNELLEKEGCSKARLWRFKADAPTTTMQRLKGLTTGSLPTFIDLSRNFASAEITEDNILDQFRASGKNITFMGDDTWMGLFPGRFNKAFPFPSFDVKDLHLVDNGILKHLMPEIAEKDWQLLIAHFLGVDHCGHRYGPYHPQMSLKLQQMNEVVKDVVRSIDQKTLLLVMGDHGMTSTGDHGGETLNEVNAALFAYNGFGGFKHCTGTGPREPTVKREPTVNQVDIVPTISLLMRTAIPFANLGVLIGDMLPTIESDLDAGQKLHEAMFVNAQQIHSYLAAYQKITNSLPHEFFDESNAQYEKLKQPDVVHGEEKFLEYMKFAKEMCQMVWAKFNIALMLSALAVLLLWLTSCSMFQIGFFHNAFNKIFCVTAAFTLLSATFFFTARSFAYDIVGLAIFLISLLLVIVSIFALLQNAQCGVLFSAPLQPVLHLGIYFVCFTTNSFILNEDITVLYLSASSCLCIFLEVIFLERHSCSTVVVKSDDSNGSDLDEKCTLSLKKLSKLAHQKKNLVLKNYECSQDFVLRDILSPFGKSWLKVVLYYAIAMICVRVALLFRCCRAEQFWCFEENDITGTESKIRYTIIKTSASFTSLICCIGGISSGFKGVNVAKIFILRILGLATMLCAAGWFTQIVPPERIEFLPEWFPTVFPRCVYAVLIIFFLFKWIDPVQTLATYSICPLDDSAISLDHSNYLQSEVDVATSMSNSIVMTTLGFCMLFCLFLGPEMATAIPLWITSSYCILQLVSRLRYQKSAVYVSFSHVITWNMLCSFWWFATGHQASISSIRWDAAFVGFQGNHVTNIIPAVLLLLDTFSMQILSSVSIPLLVFWRIPNQGDLPIPHSKRLSGRLTDSEILNDLFRKHLCFHVVKIIGCMVAASLHRRHLMVWWIFAPRYLFEFISLITVVTASLFSYADVCNVERKIQAVLAKSATKVPY